VNATTAESKKRRRNIIAPALRRATNRPPACSYSTFQILVNYADFETGRNAYPSKERIAEETNHSVRSVQRHLQMLYNGHWIDGQAEPDAHVAERYERLAPQRRPPLYRVVLATLSAAAITHSADSPFARCEHCHPEPKADHRRVSKRHHGRQNDSPDGTELGRQNDSSWGDKNDMGGETPVSPNHPSTSPSSLRSEAEDRDIPSRTPPSPGDGCAVFEDPSTRPAQGEDDEPISDEEQEWCIQNFAEFQVEEAAALLGLRYVGPEYLKKSSRALRILWDVPGFSEKDTWRVVLWARTQIEQSSTLHMVRNLYDLWHRERFPGFLVNADQAQKDGHLALVEQTAWMDRLEEHDNRRGLWDRVPKDDQNLATTFLDEHYARRKRARRDEEDEETLTPVMPRKRVYELRCLVKRLDRLVTR
jgi:cell division septation protein DedD